MKHSSPGIVPGLFDMEVSLLDRKFDKAVRDGRATEIFALGMDGDLRIVQRASLRHLA